MIILAQTEDERQAVQPGAIKPQKQPDDASLPIIADEDPAEEQPQPQVIQPPEVAPQEPETAPVLPTGPEPEPAGELPQSEEQPFDPSTEFEKVIEQPSELDQLNSTMTIEEKVDMAIRERNPLRIIYTTIKGHTTERTVDPDYRHVSMTGNDVLVAWCRLRNDWRGFIVNRIRAAKLEEIGS